MNRQEVLRKLQDLLPAVKFEIRCTPDLTMPNQGKTREGYEHCHVYVCAKSKNGSVSIIGETSEKLLLSEEEQADTLQGYLPTLLQTALFNIQRKLPKMIDPSDAINYLNGLVNSASQKEGY